MSARISIWQCQDECCEDRPHKDRYWLARSRDFKFYEQVSTWDTAITRADLHLRTLHLKRMIP